jgi:hypothetical protein
VSCKNSTIISVGQQLSVLVPKPKISLELLLQQT